MFEAPTTPVNENETTSVAIPNHAALDIVEAVVEDVPGRVNIVNHVMYRDMPECVAKGAISVTWGRLYGAYMASNRLFSSGGTAGTTYTSGNLLCPDFSVWNLQEPARHQNAGAVEHFMQPSAAPNWILEFEWYSEVHKDMKGVRKVLDGYFNEVGTNNSRVEEAWVLIKHQNVHLPNKPPRPSAALRAVRWLSYVPFIGVFFFYCLVLLDILTGVNTWTGRTRRQNHPPADTAVPYFSIYFRQHNVQHYGYYWLHWYETFTAPEPSLFGRAPPVDVNVFLEMMKARV